MAAKILSASIARVARALVPTCVFLVWGFGAYGQESTRPGCVIRHEKNGQPYVFCKSEDELKRQRRVIRPGRVAVSAAFSQDIPQDIHSQDIHSQDIHDIDASV